MRKLIITLTILMLTTNSFSQQLHPAKIIPLSKKTPSGRMYVDTTIRQYDDKKNTPKNSMPNVLTPSLVLPYKSPKYLGNNGKGFNIYESQVDNMPILVPDSTNRNIMPGQKNKLQHYLIPKNPVNPLIDSLPKPNAN